MDMEVSWRDRAIEAMRFAVWMFNHQGGTLDGFRLEEKRKTTFKEWSARVDCYQRTGRWF